MVTWQPVFHGSSVTPQSFLLGCIQNMTLLSTILTGLHSHLRRPWHWNPLMCRSLSVGISMAWCRTKVLPTRATQAFRFLLEAIMGRILELFVILSIMSFMLFSKNHPISKGLVEQTSCWLTAVYSNHRTFAWARRQFEYASFLLTWIIIDWISANHGKKPHASLESNCMIAWYSVLMRLFSTCFIYLDVTLIVEKVLLRVQPRLVMAMDHEIFVTTWMVGSIKTELSRYVVYGSVS